MKLLKPKYRRLMRALAIPAILIFLLSVIAMVTAVWPCPMRASRRTTPDGCIWAGAERSRYMRRDKRCPPSRPTWTRAFCSPCGTDSCCCPPKNCCHTGSAGNEDEQQADEDGALYKELKAQRRSFTAADGTVYTLRHEMLAAQVVTDSGSVVFSEPGWANVLKPLLALAGLYVIFAAGYIALDRFATLEATGHLDQV